MFGLIDAQDFKFRFVINSVHIHFEQHKGKARQAFQDFIRLQDLDHQAENN